MADIRPHPVTEHYISMYRDLKPEQYIGDKVGYINLRLMVNILGRHDFIKECNYKLYSKPTFIKKLPGRTQFLCTCGSAGNMSDIHDHYECPLCERKTTREELSWGT